MYSYSHSSNNFVFGHCRVICSTDGILGKTIFKKYLVYIPSWILIKKKKGILNHTTKNVRYLFLSKTLLYYLSYF